MVVWIMLIILLLLTFFRLLAPVVIFRFRKTAILLSLILDIIDWNIFLFATNNNYNLYQLWDKVLDTSMYAIFLLYIFNSWKDRVAVYTGLILFLYRLIGVIYFESTGNITYLLYFPDIFINYFVFTEIYRMLTGTENLYTSFKQVQIYVAILTLPKIVQEYILHIRKILPWQTAATQIIKGTTFIPESINMTVWTFILFSLPLSLLLIKISSLNT